MWYSFVAIQATVFEAMLAVAGYAVVHLHVAPDVARVAADAVLLVGAQGIGRTLVAVAALAFHLSQLDVRDVRKVDILGWRA